MSFLGGNRGEPSDWARKRFGRHAGRLVEYAAVNDHANEALGASTKLVCLFFAADSENGTVPRLARLWAVRGCPRSTGGARH